jgi:hypothetical protein
MRNHGDHIAMVKLTEAQLPLTIGSAANQGGIE